MIVGCLLHHQGGAVLVEHGHAGPLRPGQRGKGGEELNPDTPLFVGVDVRQIAGIRPIGRHQSLPRLAGTKMAARGPETLLRIGTVADLMDMEGVPTGRQADHLDSDEQTVRALGQGSRPRRLAVSVQNPGLSVRTQALGARDARQGDGRGQNGSEHKDRDSRHGASPFSATRW